MEVGSEENWRTRIWWFNQEHDGSCITRKLENKKCSDLTKNMMEVGSVENWRTRSVVI